MKQDWDKNASGEPQNNELNDLFSKFAVAYQQSSPAEKAAFEEHLKEGGLPSEIARIGWRIINAEYQRNFHAQMTPEEAEADRRAKAAHMRNRRAHMTQEDKAAEKAAKAAYMRKKRANMTSEQREAERLKKTEHMRSLRQQRKQSLDIKN